MDCAQHDGVAFFARPPGHVGRTEIARKNLLAADLCFAVDPIARLARRCHPRMLAGGRALRGRADAAHDQCDARRAQTLQKRAARLDEMPTHCLLPTREYRQIGRRES